MTTPDEPQLADEPLLGDVPALGDEEWDGMLDDAFLAPPGAADHLVDSFDPFEPSAGDVDTETDSPAEVTGDEHVIDPSAFGGLGAEPAGEEADAAEDAADEADADEQAAASTLDDELDVDEFDTAAGDLADGDTGADSTGLPELPAFDELLLPIDDAALPADDLRGGDEPGDDAFGFDDEFGLPDPAGTDPNADDYGAAGFDTDADALTDLDGDGLPELDDPFN